MLYIGWGAIQRVRPDRSGMQHLLPPTSRSRRHFSHALCSDSRDTGPRQDGCSRMPWMAMRGKVRMRGRGVPYGAYVNTGCAPYGVQDVLHTLGGQEDVPHEPGRRCHLVRSVDDYDPGHRCEQISLDSYPWPHLGRMSYVVNRSH